MLSLFLNGKYAVVDDSERCRSGVNVDTTDVSWSQDSLLVEHWTPYRKVASLSRQQEQQKNFLLQS